MKNMHITFNELDAALIHGALKDKLTQVKDDLDILNLTKKRDLTETERYALPTNLQHLSQEELTEQIDPWISLKMHYEYLINTFNSDNW